MIANGDAVPPQGAAGVEPACGLGFSDKLLLDCDTHIRSSASIKHHLQQLICNPAGCRSDSTLVSKFKSAFRPSAKVGARKDEEGIKMK